MKYIALFMFFKIFTHLNKAVQSKQFSKTLPYCYVPTCRILLCKVLKQMLSLCKCHQQLKVKNILLRKAEILQNAKIAHQPRCLYRFHQLLPDIDSYINIKHKSFQRVTHEISYLCVSCEDRAHKNHSPPG